MIDKIMFYVGAILFLVGIGGMAGACEGEGSFFIAAVVFATGLGISCYEFVRGTEWEI